LVNPLLASFWIAALTGFLFQTGLESAALNHEAVDHAMKMVLL
jgi:hypothetical protein